MVGELQPAEPMLVGQEGSPSSQCVVLFLQLSQIQNLDTETQKFPKETKVEHRADPEQ